MFKTPMLNSDICRVLANMGHTDRIAIADAGLPIPDHIERIDLALIEGLPSFLDVLKATLVVMKVEKAVLATEIQERNPEIHQAVVTLLKQHEPNIAIMYISHEDFKNATSAESCKAIVRTGECRPYANIILESGVVF